MDLDYFKQVNDTHGHDVGDQVLVEVARRIQQHLFSNDVVARWGGKFVLLLSGSLAPQQQLDIIRLAIAQTPIDTPSDAGASRLQLCFGGIADESAQS
ncbi:GGDEF domain-containing protein [Vibrio chagasii]|nr:GGDEF domain-containing protein [Vibrio chagasii]